MSADSLSTLTKDSSLRGRKLIVMLADRVTEHVLPNEGVIVLGRGDSADIMIDHLTLSRSHAKLTLSAHVTIEDCGSRNGTVVGGRKLARGEVVILARGASIELGDALIVVRADDGGAELLGTSDEGPDAALGSFERTLTRIASAPVSVFIGGEPGVGKAFTAERIHRLSARNAGPLITLRCHEGLSAGAIATALREAEHGVLLIDEPSALTHDQQSALAAALGAADALHVRTLTTSTSKLTDLERRDAFSADLLHRLATLTLLVPPLRARLHELVGIAEKIIGDLAVEHRRPPPLLSGDALALLQKHTWPGNIRELRNALTQAMLLGKGRVLTATHFSSITEPVGYAAEKLSSAVSELEHRRILEALRECHGNQTHAAKKLGIARGTLIARLERYGIPRPQK